MSNEEDPWYPAAPGVPDAEERLRLVRRIFPADRSEIAVFENGTVIVCALKGKLSVEEILATYDVPFDGEGSPLGDINWTPFDDGTVMFNWPGSVQGFGMYLATREEIAQLVGGAAEVSPTEVFQGGSLESIQFLRAGLVARHRRTLDAKGKKRVATSEGAK